MQWKEILEAALLLGSLAAVEGRALRGKPSSLFSRQSNGTDGLQDIVTWDEHSLSIRGERIMFFSGEFHPYRLPVPSLWLDVFQKIKSLGYNGVSFYIDWALLEGKQGNFTAEGIFALEPFFEAMKQAGIYGLARPGPYINAEVSGGGFPGWLQRNPAQLRTRLSDFLHATDNYMANVGKIIADAQITNGGPIILFQPENEYTNADMNITEFPDPVYFGYVEDQARKAGITVPFISNDASPKGYFAPGWPSAVNIYGHDSYPLGFDCANPYTWPDGSLPLNFGDLHEEQSPSTPYSLIEFQGGAFDPWGGLGFDQCAELLNAEFERVFYKNDFSYGATVFNIYMTYGGTNWGNLGHPGGYTSYDYGAVIKEDRSVSRQKYSEAKLIANFLQASPAYLSAVPQSNANANGSYTDNSAIAVTALLGSESDTNFYVVRHASYNSRDDTNYRMTLPTSKGGLTIPQLGGQLTLHGRDSKFTVTDYDVGGVNLLYSTAEIFTWKKYGNKKVLVVYGGPDELHELAISNGGSARIMEGARNGVKIQRKDGATIVNFSTNGGRKVVELGCDLTIYLLDRYEAYNYWVVDLPNESTTGNFTNPKLSTSAPIVKVNHLVRTAEIADGCIHLTGDLNSTSPLEVIGGAPQHTRELTWNGERLSFHQNQQGVVSATVEYKLPQVSIPDLSSARWKVVDSLPEIQTSYDDSEWRVADLTYSNNTQRNLSTPASLYAADYGFYAGAIIYRGHFTAHGGESTIFMETQGGSAYGMSAWLNGSFIGSFYGADQYANGNTTFTLPNLSSGRNYVLTVLIDQMGLDENFVVGPDDMKSPRGILRYTLAGHNQSDITWKLTGNLGGEDYRDYTRGPLNEGGLWAERQGYHLPSAPTSSWDDSTGPNEGVASAGVAFYATTIDLDMPEGYDIPLSLTFANTTTSASASNSSSAVAAYRCQIFVNGYQFGKYVHNIGPQDSFPVPEGIWDYHGSNYVAVSLWSLEAEGARTSNLSLVAGFPVQSGYGPVALSPMTGWEKREGAY
ncbi:glycoside hydrolase family 35 protein [Polychaeton citri CBS 116435]|uniref:Beta-galactosidase n=1 Tax=Polychaeton citri CBS 116435 TaxID=1314669 RepID=A0A9P4QFC1_9PEZI|nr:glycoside hydrolase family 35 protein [Polychaeton citri CBS 116435]